MDNDVETGTIQPEGSAESITVQHAQFTRRKRRFSWLKYHSFCTAKQVNTNENVVQD